MRKEIQKIKNKNIYIQKNGESRFVYLGRGKSNFHKEINFIAAKKSIKHEINIKVVLWDDAYFDLGAKLIVKKGAKNTNTFLRINCLLMSDNARARVIPGLEIMEDAVKSGHGATISTIDLEQVQYLKSRGLGQKQAEDLIINGFLNYS
jgi:Fe-S cluster assembly scaffold protein SufB